MKSDLEKYSFIFNREGTSRTDRYPDSLDPSKIALDDRKFEDFLVFAQKYAKNILYVPTGGDVNLRQTWEPFFKDDSIFLVANIATKEANDIRETYDLLAERFRNERTLENLVKVADYVFSRFKKIDAWYAGSSAGTVLNKEILLYIRSYLAKELVRLDQIFIYLSRVSKSGEKYLYKETLVNKNDVWGILNDKDDDVFSLNIFSLKADDETFSKTFDQVNSAFDAVFHVTANIIKKCKSDIGLSINNSQKNPPHIALFIAFIKLYGYVQSELNTIPKRMLDHYYEEVLGFKHQKAIPDKAFVTFQMAKGFDSVMIKKGTELTAGKDRTNVNLIYKTDRDIVVNKAVVEAIKTVFIRKNKSGILNYYGATIKSKGKNSDIPAGGWSVFGVQDDAQVAVIGFSIASTQLYLAKSERNVSVLLQVDGEIRVEEFDLSLFVLRLTGEKGWMSSDAPKDYVLINHFRKIDDQRLELSFSVSIAQHSAVIAFDPKIHSGGYNTAFPVLEILLRYPDLPKTPGLDAHHKFTAKIEQLDYLQSVTLAGTEIRVQVGTISQKAHFDGVRDLILQNHESVLDSKKPFLPFTSLPHVGSSFYIGCNDLFYKPNLTFTLNFEWMLPDNFRSYYDRYFPPYDSNEYMASLSILKNTHWEKLGDVSIIDAYADNAKFRVLSASPERDAVAHGADDLKKDVSKYDSSKQNGTLKLKLNYPDFGHDIYPQLITATVMEKASSKAANVDYYSIIKKQLHDSVISVKYPADVSDRNGSLKEIVYNVLDSKEEAPDAKMTMIAGLNKLIREINGSEMSSDQIKSTMNSEATNVVIVNDDNFLERIIRVIKGLKLVDKDVHFDQNKEDVENVVEGIDKQIDKRIDFILSADHEMVQLIIDETNSVISKVVAKIVEKLFSLKATKTPDGKAVEDVFKKEIEAVNKVINNLIANKITTQLTASEIPPKPYTPLINTLAISYSSTKTLKHGEDQFFQVLPFGVKEIALFGAAADNKANSAGTVNKKPVFPYYLIEQKNNDAESSGLLFIGIKDILPNQNISLLFHLAEGTRTSDSKPPEPGWWYLKNNEWLVLKDEFLISDSTFGLQTTGIVEVSVPRDADNNNTLFDESGLYWLGVSIEKDITAFPHLIDIIAQTAIVTFYDDGNDPLHLSSPLPPKTITNLAEKLPDIKMVDQPVASKGGKIAENGAAFYTRVSERLGHKGRAITNRDYERLVLERFPSIYRVKCLSNYNNGTTARGHVTLVLIANLPVKAAGVAGLVVPRINYAELLEIAQFVQSRSSPFVKIHAINAQLNYVKVSCKVRFYKGEDKGYCLRKLNDEMVSFLTPWLADDNEAVTFFGTVYISNIVSFIDKRPYVDYVTDLSVKQYFLDSRGGAVDCGSGGQAFVPDESQCGADHSILVSAPVHDIQLI